VAGHAEIAARSWFVLDRTLAAEAYQSIDTTNQDAVVLIWAIQTAGAGLL